MGPLQKRRQSQKAFDEMKKAADVRNVEPERLAGNLLHRFQYRSKNESSKVILFRASYLSNKKLAETGRRIEQGELVQPLKTLSVDHATWLCTVGAGLGQKQWR